MVRQWGGYLVMMGVPMVAMRVFLTALPWPFACGSW